MVFMVLMSLLLTLYLFFAFLELEEIKAKNLQIKDSRAYWESVVKKHPNSTDGYYNAAFYSYLSGDSGEALRYLEQAVTLDPGFENAKELEKLIRGTTP
jgi:hypothetical protein